MDFSKEQALYGLDKGGSFKFWSVQAVGDVIVVRHGKDGGVIIEKKTTAKPKNIGKANETTGEQQALAEAQSKYNKQVDKGYRANKDELGDLPFLPMLASDYLKVPHKAKFPLHVQPKLDGVRCSVFLSDTGKLTFLSRGGKEYDLHNTPVYESVSKLFQNLNPELAHEIVLDGELYLHGSVLQDIVSSVKRVDAKSVAEKSGDMDDIYIADLRESLELHLFDIYSKTSPLETCQDRMVKLHNLYKYYEKIMPTDANIVLVHTEIVDSVDDLDQVLHDTIEDLYEGVILRNLDGVYTVGKRSGDLLKYKLFKDDEFEIVGVNIDKDGLAVFECYCPLAQETFGCTLGTHQQRKDQAENPEQFIGKYLTVKYQARYADTQLPQFPTGVRFREVNGGEVQD